MFVFKDSLIALPGYLDFNCSLLHKYVQKVNENWDPGRAVNNFLDNKFHWLPVQNSGLREVDPGEGLQPPL